MQSTEKYIWYRGRSTVTVSESYSISGAITTPDFLSTVTYCNVVCAIMELHEWCDEPPYIQWWSARLRPNPRLYQSFPTRTTSLLSKHSGSLRLMQHYHVMDITCNFGSGSILPTVRRNASAHEGLHQQHEKRKRYTDALFMNVVTSLTCQLK